MRAGAPAAVIAALVAIAASATYAQADPGTRPSPSMIGVNHVESHHDDVAVSGAVAMGARFDRMDFWRGDSQGTDDWIFMTDAARGLRVLPILLRYEVPFTAANNSDFATWADGFIRRYGAGGDFWREHRDLDPSLAPTIFEVENEAYGWWFFPDAPDAPGYADLYKRVVTAGRAINPSFRFLFSATADVYTQAGQRVDTWAHLVKAADPTIGSYIDGLAVHPYGARAAGELVNLTSIVRNQFIDEGITAPVYVTEVGLCTSNQADTPSTPCGTAADQATAVKAWFGDFRATPWIYALFAYQYQDPCTTDLPCTDTNPSPYDPNNWWGLVDRFGTPKPGYSVYQTQAALTP